jgi:hypothetical protein
MLAAGAAAREGCSAFGAPSSTQDLLGQGLASSGSSPFTTKDSRVGRAFRLPASSVVSRTRGFLSLSTGHNHVGNLVDSASSHTLVSKIKPCMSKYKRFIL